MQVELEVPVQDKDRFNLQWNERCPPCGHVKFVSKNIYYMV
jgi:hypothetical protein